MDRYIFRAATMQDLPRLRQWQRQPHVAEWWDSEEPFSEEDLRDDRVARWIVSEGDTPFAFMQDYSVHGWDDHPFQHLPKGARGIDQYIGEPAFLGRGHGQAFLRQRMRTLFANGAPALGTDPDPANQRAIAVYQKIGFKIAGEPRNTSWGRILPMVAHRPA